ncbi:hypothetical protein JDV02_006613 [Purpureocillium takamizusanense]|uniref:DNA replication checkpoint mediator MRC1 domain-containing protein n=1 Tax=Purpureocillium takamizusanense TaxID=2060973 RepID=A0A9Q8QJ10_9HYPO|nr:uncharacterized protein JDV02_006613 [Purpureocillium takamizusanense]UNI20535.1 hypothetical protein JDV02_006613 [Purpureocillium takamizusanense]
MASSRASSPASREASPEQLTPRSKIKALLATVESSDDEGIVEKPNKSRHESPTTKHNSASNRDLQPTHMNNMDNSGDDSDDSDIPVRPRGKLASRMQGKAVASKDVEAPSDAPETARERVRKMLAREADAEAAATRGEEAGQDNDDDDELPVAPRRLKRRMPRDPTPDGAEQPAPRSPSPGLFVSSPVRPSPTKSAHADQDSDNDLPALKSDRFKALVERKRQERLAREAAEEARKAEQRARQEKLASELEPLDSDDGNDTGITDDEGGRKLTQEARPTRKASRKAIEEMNRETQRIARNMQLAHEARTRKKITKASLFERFNYRPAGDAQPEPKTTSSSRPGTPPTDVEMKDVDTPPSSPPATKEPELPVVPPHGDATMPDVDDEELPSLDEMMSSSQPLEKGKGKASAYVSEQPGKTTPKPKRRVRVRLPTVAANVVTIDSDDELEVTKTTRDKVMAVFDKIPANCDHESKSMKALRALALVKSPGKDNSRGQKDQSRMTAGELQALLYQRARQQAKMERDRRLNLLKSQGIVIQTADERERQQQEVEDLVAKAREEAQKIMQEERAAAKKSRKENGESDPLAWDDSEDEEYEDPANEADAEASAVELSGSEDEEDEEDEEDKGNPLIDEDAESGASEHESADEGEAVEHEDADDAPMVKRRRGRNTAVVLSDDEADVEATPRPVRTATQVTPGAPKTVSPAAPTSVLRSAKKTFIPGLPVQGPAGLGLTQIFAGTMDDSQASPSAGPTQSMMPDFDAFPDSNFSATAETQGEDVIMDSQPDTAVQETQTQGVRLNMSQSQMHGLDSLFPVGLTQASEPMEASQDAGLQEYTPIKQRFVEPPASTVDTLPMGQDEEDAPHESPLVRRGRLRRKMEMSVIEEESVSSMAAPAPPPGNAFSAMADAARKEKRRQHAEEFNRKKTKAREMVEEQAEESEDEYAGLGGADGEDSDNESQGSLQEMVDDDAANDVDGSKLAAFYADRERASDEKEVEKLFKDITTGMLRRKRGADYDLSDSDDGGEARRRMKRRQFAKMQKALFADERVKKIAENPGNQAFLRTIEDHGSDDEMDFLDLAAGSQEQADSQSQEDTDAEKRPEIIPDSQPAKQTLVPGEDRAPAHMRRTKGAAAKKPANLGEVRETLSSLLEERQPSVVPATEVGSDSEDEQDGQGSPRSDKENREPNPRRTGPAVVDRISLKRNASSSSASGARLAFAAQGTSSFKVPALLRRATTNSTIMSGSTASSGSGGSTGTAVMGSAGGFGEDAKIKRGAGKGSGINGFAREREAAGAVKESERRREQRKVKGAVRRVGVVGGLLGKGSFE